MKYAEFLKNKQIQSVQVGIERPKDPNPILFDFQKDIVKWALKVGRACIFADCGMGKTFMQLEWAKQINGNVIIFAPLAVTRQTIKEGEKLGITVKYCRDQKEVCDGITITNYDMIENFNPDCFSAVVLDESSCIKHFDSKFRNMIISRFSGVKFRLACTATPAPNDHMELGNHAEFVGSMTRTEMLSMFFVHDGGDTSKWRIKGHAKKDFWKWVCSWAVMIRRPSDLGYNDGSFVLPPVKIEQITVEHMVKGDYLFAMEANTLQERIAARRESMSERVDKCAEIVNASKDPWIIWCNLNTESEMLANKIEDSVEIVGSESPEIKADKMLKFSSGEIRILITKPSISGFGMNWQHCNNVAFVGLSDSWEQYYQAVRRCWRFGQKKEVNVYLITSSAEGQIVQNIKRKEKDANTMAVEMVNNMKDINSMNIKGTVRTTNEYVESVVKEKNFTLMLGDCVEMSKKIESNSVGLSVFSPPFASLYTYSASDRDMGNCKDADEFFIHFQYMIKDLFRIMQPGRNVSFHCMNLPTSKTNHGFIGIRDFRGQLIKAFQDCCFIFHSEVCIWKDPVTAMQRTKALGLLHKQVVKDSAMSRQGIPDYLVTMRKPGDNANPVEGELDRWIGDDTFKSTGRLSIDLWQRYASPVWMDINASRTLQKQSAREDNDERHICPLQLDVIERAVELWSNPGDTVFSPFAGIGSEGYISLKTGRKFIGIELKKSYFDQALKNLIEIDKVKESDMFSFSEDDERS